MCYATQSRWTRERRVRLLGPRVSVGLLIPLISSHSLECVWRPIARRSAGAKGQAADCRRERGRVSLTGRWLPQLDLVALRIDDPGKLAVLRVIDLVEDVAAFRFEP